MVRAMMTGALVGLTLAWCSCDLADLTGATPRQLEAKAERAIRPYFPRAVARLDAQSEQLLVVTCADNIGDQLLHEMAPKIMEMPDVRLLSTVRRSRLGTAATQLAGVHLPRFMSLAFDRSALVLDTDTGRYAVTSNPPPVYFTAYREGCAPSAATPATAPVQSQPANRISYVWIGTFRVTYQDRDGNQQSTTGQDSLGVYPSDVEFRMQQEEEVAARRALIEKQFSRDGGRVLSVELQQVQKVPVGGSGPESQVR